jgi:hypothetical protein
MPSNKRAVATLPPYWRTLVLRQLCAEQGAQCRNNFAAIPITKPVLARTMTPTNPTIHVS